jgi:hypothetical protein
LTRTTKRRTTYLTIKCEWIRGECLSMLPVWDTKIPKNAYKGYNEDT